MTKGEKTLINDSYNANPESLKAGLNSLAKMYPNRPKVLVLGDMLELGQISAIAHREVGNRVAIIPNLRLLCCIGHQAKQIQGAAIAGGLRPEQTIWFETADMAINHIAQISSAGNTYYFKASRAMKLEKILDALI